MARPTWWPERLSAKRALPVAAAVVVGVVLIVQLVAGARLKGALTLAQQHVQELGQRNQELGQELDRTLADRRRLGEQLDSVRKQFASVSQDLEAARQRAGELESQAEQVRVERVELQARLATLTEERNEAVSETERLEQENEELQRSAGSLRERLALLKRDYGQLAEKLQELQARSLVGTASVASVAGPTPASAGAVTGTTFIPTLSQSTMELPPIVVRKSQAGMSLPVRGRLLEVNPAHGFVVLDQGSEDGVRPGAVFDVVRGSTTVGRAVAVRVRPHLTACDILKTQTPGELHIGDSVVERGSSP